MRKQLCLLAAIGLMTAGCEKKIYVLDRYATMRLEELNVPASARTQELRTVDFVSANEGFVGGDNGTILVTADGGVTWESRTQSTLGTVYKLTFSSATAGWAATSTGLYRTTNAGQSWQRLGTAAFDVQFVTPQIGYAVGNDVSIYKTTNGGTTWALQNSVPFSASLRSVSFSSPDSGMAVGTREAVYTTTNGGRTWSTPSFSQGLSGRDYHAVLKFRRPAHYLLAGVTSSGLLSGSGMQEWDGTSSYSPEDQNTFTMHGICRFEDRILVVGENTVIRKDPALSNNPYTPWAHVLGSDGTTMFRSFRAADFADRNTVYAVGPQGLLVRLRY
jgi:hypothetical protein